MHELSLCDDLLGQVIELAKLHRAESVISITVNIGVLSGVEPSLLESAFTIGRVDTLAGNARLIVQEVPARVQCERCGAEADVSTNQLFCPVCLSHETRLISGNELILASVEMDTPA